MKGDIKSVIRLLMRHLPRLDLYGGAVRSDPARYPKSHIGALVSILCFGAAIALVALNASRLYGAAMAQTDDGVSNIVSMGTEYIKFNAFIRDPETGELTGADDGRWDLPALMIECSSNIEFFNRDARKLHKIEVRDNNGNHRSLTSSRTPTPVASGLYKKVPVSRGSVNLDLEPGAADQHLSVSLAASLGFKELHSGQEIIRVLKNIKQGTRDFFDHQANAYVRLLPWQMQSVKSCQLQVWLSNQGQYLSMLESGLLFNRANFDRSTFTTLTSSPSTWRPVNFGKKPPYKWTENHVTLLKLSSKMTRADIKKFRENVPSANDLHDGEFMDWRVEFTYLNNFVKVIADFKCDNEDTFNRQYATVAISNGTAMPNKNASYIILDPPSPETDANALSDGKLVWPIPPFELLLSFEELAEVATVTNISETSEGRQKLVLSRSNPIDFELHGGVFPQDWQCPLKWYNDGKACNCECGAPDPDCEPGKDLPVLACPMPYSKQDTGSFCSISGHCAREPPVSSDLMLKVSQGCAKIQKPGEVILTGYVGTQQDYDTASPNGCVPCPGDVWYDGQVSLDSDSTWKCNVQTSGNVHSDTNDRLDNMIAGYLQQVRDSSTAASVAGAAPAQNSSCAAFSAVWQACMQADVSSVAVGLFVRFAQVGMRFPIVAAGNVDKAPVAVEVLLGDAVTYKGRIMMSGAPLDDLQPVVIGPDVTLSFTPENRFEQVKCLLISALNFDSTSIDVILLNRKSDGSQVAFRNGVDKNFIVRLGSSLIPILDTVPSEQLTGLAARGGGAGSSQSTTTYFNPNCSGTLDGVCQGEKTGDEGLMVTLRLVRPVAISKGKTRVVMAFDLCRGEAGGGDESGAQGNSTDGGAPGTTPARRLLQETTAADGGTPAPGGGEGEASDGAAINPDDPSTCPAGKRHRIVTTAPLFPDDMLALAGIEPQAGGAGAGDGGDGGDAPETTPARRRRLLQETTAAEGGTPAPGGGGSDGGSDSAAPLYVFPETRRPIVIVRSRGRVAEVRTVLSTQGNVLELDGDVEGNIYWPATVETTWDGKGHSCVPEHHSCVIPLYNLRMVREEEAYDPADRYLSRPRSEPTESPQNLVRALSDLELGLFTVPAAEQSNVPTRAEPAAAAAAAAAAQQTPPPTTSRRAQAPAPADVGSEGAVGVGGGDGDDRLAVGADGDTLCPNIPVSAADSGATKKYTSFNWDRWQVSADRDFEMVNCLDRKVVLPACSDLGDVGGSQLKDTCLKAMPPTSNYQFVTKLPVNNKWEVPATFLKIMRGINLPEFDMDFSLIYNLQYSADTLKVENQFSRSMETGDYLDTNNFTIYNGATDFQGLGGGYDAYGKLAQVLPANHPVLRNTLVLGVDPGKTLADLKLARTNSSSGAASLWPQDEQSIKLILERFDPLQIEWELSSIGGRSDEQVLVMQPGHEYLLEALLQVRPIYSSDLWDSSRIERWERQVVSTAASKTELSDPAQAHQVVVRYHLEFDPLVRAQTFRKAFTIKSFAESVGAATGFIVIGAMLLNGMRRLRSSSSDLAADTSQQVEYAG